MISTSIKCYFIDCNNLPRLRKVSQPICWYCCCLAATFCFFFVICVTQLFLFRIVLGWCFATVSLFGWVFAEGKMKKKANFCLRHARAIRGRRQTWPIGIQIGNAAKSFILCVCARHHCWVWSNVRTLTHRRRWANNSYRCWTTDTIHKSHNAQWEQTKCREHMNILICLYTELTATDNEKKMDWTAPLILISL